MATTTLPDQTLRALAERLRGTQKTVARHYPGEAGSREPKRIAVIAAVAKVCHDHHIVARSAVFPAMECDHLIGVVDVMDVDVLATKTARLLEPVAAQPDEVAIRLKQRDKALTTCRPLIASNSSAEPHNLRSGTRFRRVG